MDAREELMALRRMAELEAKAGGGAPAAPIAAPTAAPKEERGTLSNIGAGVASGFADLGDTLLNVGTYLPGKVIPDIKQWNDERSASLQDFNDERKDSTAFNVGRIGGNIAATLPVGGVLGGAVKGLSAAPAAQSIGTALQTGGFRAGQIAASTPARTKALEIATRIIGGVGSGAATTAAVAPGDTVQGAIIGGVLPPVLQGVGKVAGATGSAIKSAFVPKDVSAAGKLADYLGVPRDQLQAALTQQGPQMIPGYQPTVPQIVQSPEASQLQRTLKTAGFNSLGDADRVQQAQFMDTINRVAPVDLNVQDAAQRTGDAVGRYARSARNDATEAVRNAFDEIDPNGETALFLPIDEMKAAKNQILGPGTFGTGGRASEAIRTAEDISTEVAEKVPAYKPLKAAKQQDLVMAVRAAGGINTSSKSGRELAGEIRNLKESGLNNMVKSSGKSIERLAEEMHEAGFLPDNDPATLLNALQDSAGGSPVYGGSADDMYRRAMEEAQGPPPVVEAAQDTIKPVPFDHIQNLRSSMGEKAAEAEAKGANKEAAVLKRMIGEIDSRINRAAGDSVAEGEFFPKEVADRYRMALNLHAKKMERFETGPQYGMFRKGADGAPAVNGAEIPGKFFNGNRSQTDDMKAFERLVEGRPDLMEEMKRYATTEAAATASKSGNLTSSFVKWLDNRSGANRVLFDDGELASLKEVGKAVTRQQTAEDLGRVSGSDTAQKLQALNRIGLLDNKMVGLASNKIPYGAAALSALKESAVTRKNETWSKLLAEPEKFAAGLEGKRKQEISDAALKRLFSRGDPVVRSLARAAPVLSSDR